MRSTFLFLSAVASLLLITSCASSNPTSSGLPEAAHREEARRYGTPTPLSSDPSSPLHDLSTNKGQVSMKAASF